MHLIEVEGTKSRDMLLLLC